jgi:NADP-dependent 3-hydroxy acid dehydrogenase YdfG
MLVCVFVVVVPRFLDLSAHTYIHTYIHTQHAVCFAIHTGLGYPASLLDGDRSSTAQWREMLDVNVLALSICTREALQLMAPHNAGHVLHVSSMSAHRVKGSAMYAATKHAVRALTEGLRLELRGAKLDVRVTAVSPGWVETEFVTQYYGGDEQKAAAVYGRYKCLQSEDIAAAIAYAIEAPPHVNVGDILMRPLHQED